MRLLGAIFAGILLVAAVPRVMAAERQGLFVPPNAEDVVRHSRKGRASIEYYIKEAYPALATLEFLERSLSNGGWRAATGSELPSHESSSLDSGWTTIPGPRGSTVGRIWSSRWLDDRGNEVVYSLGYSSPLMEHGLEPVYLSVAGWYYSKKEAVRQREELAELTKHIPARFRDQLPPPVPSQPCPWE